MESRHWTPPPPPTCPPPPLPSSLCQREWPPTTRKPSGNAGHGWRKSRGHHNQEICKEEAGSKVHRMQLFYGSAFTTFHPIEDLVSIRFWPCHPTILKKSRKLTYQFCLSWMDRCSSRGVCWVPHQPWCWANVRWTESTRTSCQKDWGGPEQTKEMISIIKNISNCKSTKIYNCNKMISNLSAPWWRSTSWLVGVHRWPGMLTWR